MTERPTPRPSSPIGSGVPVHLVDGFHEESSVVGGRWADLQSAVEFAPRPGRSFLEFWTLSEYFDLSQELTIAAGERSEAVALPKGWSPVSFEVPSGTGRVDFVASKLLPASQHRDDPRALAVRFRLFELHDNEARHRAVSARFQNALANAREMLAGRANLKSTPPSLGIDMYAACNVKPPCVYCAWDEAKAAEGDFVDTPFTRATLREWGPLYDHSTQLVNCSIGEPFMMKNIDELFDEFSAGGKTLEITTNGQILTDTNIRKLVGRPINLYVSFDAATAETYAVLRNRRFDTMVDNVRRLVEAKGGPGRFPVVNIVFMPMKANLLELPSFVALCAGLRVDYLVLRPLNYGEQVGRNWERAEYRFEYDKELLPFDELVRCSGRAAELCRRAGVVLSDQMDFGGSLGDRFSEWYEEGRRSVDLPASVAPPPAEPPQPPAGSTAATSAPESTTLGAERTPACGEPWKSLYILRRGIFPCCYGGRPIAPMDRPAEAWNSPILREIRRDLARGQFHSYCLESPACPVVRKGHATGEALPVSWRLRAMAARQRMRHRLVWAGQWSRIRLRRILTEPAYLRHHLGRILRLAGGKSRR